MNKETFRLSVRIGTEIDLDSATILEHSLKNMAYVAELKRKSTKFDEEFWVIELGRASRPEILEERLLSLGYKVAELIGRIVQESDCNTIVSFCQDVDDADDPQQSGIVFSPELVQWAATARASIEIDQYLN